MRAGRSLPELWQLAARHHNALRSFALAHAGAWTLRVRRSAWQGLAVLASMIRRLIHLMAKEIPLAPLIAPEPGDPMTPLPGGPGRRGLGFRLIETKPERPSALPNPDRVADTPELGLAFFLERLAVLAGAYRARFRLARRMARRVQSGRAPLRAPPLPARLHARALPLFTDMLADLDARLAAPDSS